jgi:hypothetical protein
MKAIRKQSSSSTNESLNGKKSKLKSLRVTNEALENKKNKIKNLRVTNEARYHHPDLSKSKNSATSIIKANLDKLNSCKTCSELHDILSQAF